MSPDKSERDLIVSKIAHLANLPDIAEELGMQVFNRGSRNPKALCPFHEDRRPSLTFYPATETDRGRYHCFACNAHGDVYGLVMKLRGTDFRGALDWLSTKQRLPLPQSGRERAAAPRQTGLMLAHEIFSRQRPQEEELLKAFANERGFNAIFLAKAEVFVVEPSKLSKALDDRGRESFENVRAAGLIRRIQLSSIQGGALPTDLPPREFYTRPRAIFSLRDDRGKIVGFAGRALLPGDEPKYLYSPGFPRANTLYRLDHVRATIRTLLTDAPKRIDVFLVEGLLDALRLESLGLLAVAVFGSQVTADQAKLLAQLASDLDRDGIQLVLHVFFDADAPGRHAIRTALPRLIDAACRSESTGFLIDLILLPLTENKSDPDEMLRTIKGKEEALATITPWTRSLMEAFLADALSCEPETLSLEFQRIPESYRSRAFREIERRFDRDLLTTMLDRLSPFTRHFDSPADPLDPLICRAMEAFLSDRPVPPSEPAAEPARWEQRDKWNQLQLAMQVARASGQRRELPIDEGSWDRIGISAEISLPALIDYLKDGALNDEPLIATLVPKSGGDFRLKALPCAEALTLHQYVLNSLLQEHPGVPRFASLIPAVRYAAGQNGGQPWTTGGPRTDHSSETVAFAYQVDTNLVEGRLPPDREGMFRPYYRCWQDFISFIDRRASACRAPLLMSLVWISVVTTTPFRGPLS